MKARTASSTSATATTTPNWGTWSVRTLARMSRAKTKVATNIPSTAWLKRSRRNVRVTRGESCELASCSTSMVTVKTSAVKLIIAPEIAERTVGRSPR